MRGARRTSCVRRSAVRARQRCRWAFFSSLLVLLKHPRSRLTVLLLATACQVNHPKTKGNDKCRSPNEHSEPIGHLCIDHWDFRRKAPSLPRERPLADKERQL